MDGAIMYYVIDWLFFSATNMAAMMGEKRVIWDWLILYFSNQHGGYDGGGRGYFVIDWLFILATNMAAIMGEKRVFCY